METNSNKTKTYTVADLQAELQTLWAKANRIFKLNKPVARLDMSLSGTVAGMAHYPANKIQINMSLYQKNPERILKQTLPHEICHLFAFWKYSPLIKAHGKEWQACMMLMGCPPIPCHRMDVSHITGGKLYHCKCFGENKNHQVELTTHFKIKEKKISAPKCKRCNCQIVEAEKENPFTVKADKPTVQLGARKPIVMTF